MEGPASAAGFVAASLAIWAAALPLAALLFRRFPDAGAGLAFPLGLVLAGYAYFVLRLLSVADQGHGGYLVAVAVVALAGAAVRGHSRAATRALRQSARPRLLVLALFLALFATMTAYRSYVSEIAGTEQPMDFLYLNATITSPSYPPHDPWLAGETASYYYFGYLQAGLLSELAGVVPSTGYTLALAWTFAAAGAAMASLVAALFRWAVPRSRGRGPVTAAAIGVLLLLFAGSLMGPFELAAAHERYDPGLYEAFGVELLLPCDLVSGGECYAGPSPRSGDWYPTEHWFWFRDTRLIPGTITEFPVFSFILGDLHPHVMAIPLVLLAAALSAATWRTRRPFRTNEHLRQPVAFVLFVLVFGALAFQNAWDVITFLALLALAVAGRWYRRPSLSHGLGAAAFLLPIAAGAVIAYLPWYLTFGSQAGGLYPYEGAGTRPAHVLLQFGAVAIPAIGACWPILRREPAAGIRDGLLSAAWLAVLPLAGWATLVAALGEQPAAATRGGAGWTTVALYAAIVVLLGAAVAASARRRRGSAVVAAFAATGMLLLYGTELFFIRDVFFGSVPRLNTVFKLSYQAWVLLSVAGAIGLATLARGAVRGERLAAGMTVPAGLLVAASLVYGTLAVANRTQGLRADRNLDGLAFLAISSPEEYALAHWVRESVPPGAVVVEATGRSWGRDSAGALVVTAAGVDYTDAGRIAARTGRQAPIGWYFHEIQWRGDGIASELTRRQDLVDQVYTATSPDAALSALRALGADYVVVGRVERSRYPADALPPFDLFLDLVWSQGSARVYRVPVFEVRPTS